MTRMPQIFISLVFAALFDTFAAAETTTPKSGDALGLPAGAGPHLRLPEVHPRAGGQRDRRLLLLALRRRGVDRSVRDHLPHPMIPGL